VSTSVRPSNSTASQATRARPLHAGIEVDRTDQRFEGIGQDRLATETAALQFAGTQAQVFAQVETTGQHGQGLTLHQARARDSWPSRASGKREQRFAGDEVENGITEEFQALVVAPGKTAVGQGQEHQFLILEGVTELTLETA
jgi:hypothetical protein